MKILHIIAGGANGGAETYCLDAIKALHEQGVEQFVLCRPHPHYVQALCERHIPHQLLRFNRLLKWWEQMKMRRVIRAYQPDMIHCWMSRAATFVPRQRKIPVLGWFGGPYQLKNYKKCDCYMGVTRDIVEHIVRETGTPERAFLVHTFGTLERDAPVQKSEFAIPEQAKVVLLLSRMHWKKGVDTLLHAAQNLPGVYFLLAGDGPDLEKYRQMAQSMGLADRVRFPGWRNDRSALLGIADVCVLPSRYEPFGTVIVEAWFAGVPLVATRADGARQYVTHEQDGLLCEIDDVAGLTHCLNQALTDEVLRQRLQTNGQATYQALFSKEKVSAALVAAYQKIMALEKR